MNSYQAPKDYLKNKLDYSSQQVKTQDKKIEEIIEELENFYNDFQDMKLFIQMMLHHLRPDGDFAYFNWDDIWKLREIADRLDRIDKKDKGDGE